MPRPNVLFIFTDQQTLKAMSCAGNPHVHTPYMDSLAAGGVRFEGSYCTSPVCSPARASLLTGRMPHEIGVDHNELPTDVRFPNMGEIFRGAGYHTAWSGKWHLPWSYAEPSRGEFIRGFFHMPLPPTMPMGLGDTTDGLIAERAASFIRSGAAKEDKPWLLGVSVHNPHDICGWIWKKPFPQPHPELLPPLPDNFEKTDIEPEFIEMCRQRTHYGNEQNATVNWDENQWRAYLHAYYHMTEQVDRAIGRVLTALDQSGQAENTLVIFTSDHGEGCAAHRWVVKLMLYEEEVAVPLIVRFPGVVPSGVVDRSHLVSGMDVLPTMCDYAGIEAPPMTGTSLRPLIDQPDEPGREYLVAELSPDTEDHSMRGRMVRTAKYKYVVFSKGEHPEMLFDMDSDPGEMKNLAYEASYAETVATHRVFLEEWQEKTGDPFVSGRSLGL